MVGDGVDGHEDGTYDQDDADDVYDGISHAQEKLKWSYKCNGLSFKTGGNGVRN